MLGGGTQQFSWSCRGATTLPGPGNTRGPSFLNFSLVGSKAVIRRRNPLRRDSGSKPCVRLPGAPPSKCAPDLLPPVSSPWGSRRRRAGWGWDSPPRLQNPEPPHALHGIHGSTQNYKWLNQTWTSLFTSMDEISNEILSNTLDISTWQFHRLFRKAAPL